MDVPAAHDVVFYVEQSNVWSSLNVTSCRFPIPWYDPDVPFGFKYQEFRSLQWLSNSYLTLHSGWYGRLSMGRYSGGWI